MKLDLYRDDKRRLLFLGRRIQAIAHPWIGKQISWMVRIKLDFLSKRGHKNTKILWLMRAVGSPGRVDYRRVCQHTSTFRRKNNNNSYFLGDFCTIDRHVARERIHAKVTSAQHLEFSRCRIRRSVASNRRREPRRTMEIICAHQIPGSLGSRRYTPALDGAICEKISHHLPDVEDSIDIRYARDLRLNDLKQGNAILLVLMNPIHG